METSRSGASIIGEGEGRGASGTSNHFLNGDGNFNDAQSLVLSQTTSSNSTSLATVNDIIRKESFRISVGSSEERKDIASETEDIGVTARAVTSSSSSKVVESPAREGLREEAGMFHLIYTLLTQL
jgi:hypothetical protein